MPIDLYLSINSPASRTALSVAKHLGIEVNLKPIDLHKGEQLNPDFVKLNPAHTVPTIDDDGFVLWESRAIAQYLCNKYAPDSELYPHDPKRRAVVDRLLNFDLGTLYPLAYVVMNSKYIRGIEPPEDKLAAFTNSLKLLDLFIGDNKYVAGTQLTIADLSLFSLASFFISFPDELPNECANLKEWLDRLQTELPYFEEVHGKTIRDMPSLFAQMREKLSLNNQDQQNSTENK